MSHYVTPNEFYGTDSQRINQAIATAVQQGSIVRIPRINQHVGPNQPENLWLLDEAILLPSNITVELHDCNIKLSDKCRDNFFRSANCGIGIAPIEPAHNIHIIGKGNPVLIGADHPRSTGDSGKTLGQRAFAGEPYGTDTGVEGQPQKGDWRNIGILMANVSHFSVQNITIIDSHCWALSFEYCSIGTLRDIRFSSKGRKTIDGKSVIMYNQDGIDLRQGCHDILIENISGETGDDMIALTAIFNTTRVAGGLGSTMISAGNEDPQDIHDVVIRNVRGRCEGGHHIVRLLNTGKSRMENILIDGVVDTTRPGHKRAAAAVKIGELKAYGGITPVGSTRNIVVNNVIASTRNAVAIGGSLADSIITNIIHDNAEGEPVHVASGPEYIRNVTISNAIKGSVETDQA